MYAAEIWSWVGERTVWQALLGGLGFALVFEAVTCFMRFGLGMEAARDTQWVGVVTAGYRLHHGYIGIALLLAAVIVPNPAWRNLLVIAGVGLVVSDAVHHFLVLRLATGSPEFHTRYERYNK